MNASLEHGFDVLEPQFDDFDGGSAGLGDCCGYTTHQEVDAKSGEVVLLAMFIFGHLVENKININVVDAKSSLN